MASTTITWPSAILGDPLVEGFAYQMKSGLLRTGMASGRVRQILRRRTDIRTLQISLLLRQYTMPVFINWHHETLQDGALWFNMELNLGVGFNYYQVRIVDGLYTSEHVYVNNTHGWRVTMEIEVENFAYWGTAEWASFDAVVAGSTLNPVTIFSDLGSNEVSWSAPSGSRALYVELQATEDVSGSGASEDAWEPPVILAKSASPYTFTGLSGTFTSSRIRSRDIMGNVSAWLYLL